MAVRCTHRCERTGIVESEKLRVVVVLGQRDAFARKHALEGAEMQRLAVREDAVEVEDDRSKRHYVFGRLSFSPARIGTFKRFSAGGYGHS